jgi:hypothetical protein
MLTRIGVAALLTITASGCGRVTIRNNLQPLVSSLQGAMNQQIPDSALRAAVSAYVTALDSLRVLNLEAALEQRRDRDWYVGGALFLSAAALGVAATNMDEGDKARPESRQRSPGCSPV